MEDSLGAGTMLKGWFKLWVRLCGCYFDLGIGGGEGNSSRLYYVVPVSMGVVKNLVLLCKSCQVILSGDTLTLANIPGLPKNMSFPRMIE